MKGFDRALRVFLLLGFAVIGTFFVINTSQLLLRHIFEFRPDKLSIDRTATILFSGVWLTIAALFAILFDALLKRRKYFVIVYWLTFAVGIAIQVTFNVVPFANPRHFLSDLLFLSLLQGIPFAVGIYVTVKRRHFL
jgi:hypothetical protein